jgi:hypothetical protein
MRNNRCYDRIIIKSINYEMNMLLYKFVVVNEIQFLNLNNKLMISLRL